MAKLKAIVRQINALENLGNVTDICSDKTGTLTQGKMVATNIWTSDDRRYTITGNGVEPTGELFSDQEPNVPLQSPFPIGVERVLTVGSLCNASGLSSSTNEAGETEWATTGSPTEVALIVLGKKVLLYSYIKL